MADYIPAPSSAGGKARAAALTEGAQEDRVNGRSRSVYGCQRPGSKRGRYVR